MTRSHGTHLQSGSECQCTARDANDVGLIEVGASERKRGRRSKGFDTKGFRVLPEKHDSDDVKIEGNSAARRRKGK